MIDTYVDPSRKDERGSGRRSKSLNKVAYTSHDRCAWIGAIPSQRMRISVIIPTYNEAENIGNAVRHLLSIGNSSGAEVIISDGGSTDNTLAIAEAEGATVTLSTIKGRAGQMNHGASLAHGDILHFVHADTRPPVNSAAIVSAALASGADHGSFRTRFDSDRFMLKVNAFFTRFDLPYFRGGDQSIWVTRDLFVRAGGYKTEMLIMEEYDLLARLRKIGTFHLSDQGTLISARKYDHISWLRVQLANMKVVRMYRRGASQEEIVRTYGIMLNYRPNAS